jgi:heat shock protein HtpX
MYEQIARNKRRTVVCIAVFFLVWMGMGAVLGAMLSGPRTTTVGYGSFGEPITTTSAGNRSGGVVAGMVVAAMMAGAGTLFALSSGAKFVLSASGAKPADPDQYRELHNIVEALAIGSGLPKPAVYIIDDPSPNAFATGTSPRRAAITATTGLLELMDRAELEGVIAHEMSHIKNYDVRLLVIVTTLIGMAGLLASLLWRSALYVRPRGKDGNQFAMFVIVAGALLGIIGFVVGPIIRLAISRRRESLADASAVELTRNPAGLLRALRKLEADNQPFASYNHVSSAMCIDDPPQPRGRWFHHLFDTHPPIAERIAALERIAQGEAV